MWEPAWVVFVSLPVIQLLIAADRVQNTDGYQNRLQRGSRVRLGTEVGCPSTGTALAKLPYSERPGDTLASWR